MTKKSKPKSMIILRKEIKGNLLHNCLLLSSLERSISSDWVFEENLETQQYWGLKRAWGEVAAMELLELSILHTLIRLLLKLSILLYYANCSDRFFFTLHKYKTMGVWLWVTVDIEKDGHQRNFIQLVAYPCNVQDSWTKVTYIIYIYIYIYSLCAKIPHWLNRL